MGCYIQAKGLFLVDLRTGECLVCEGISTRELKSLRESRISGNRRAIAKFVKALRGKFHGKIEQKTKLEVSI
jgi:hypothetical protein